MSMWQGWAEKRGRALPSVESSDSIFIQVLISVLQHISSVFEDYHFVKREDMEKAIRNSEFIEHAEYSKNLYGTRYGRYPAPLFLL